MNQIVADSENIAANYKRLYLKQSISHSVTDIGKFSLNKIIKIFKNYINLFQALRMNDIDLVYFALTPSGKAFIKDFISILIIKQFDVPIVFHLHSKGVKKYQQKKFFHFLYNYAFNNEFCIILSSKLKDDIVNCNFKNHFILPNGIKDNCKNNLTSIDSSFTITFLANYLYDKGVFEYLEVIRILNHKIKNFRFDLIGQPKDISLEQVNEFICKNDLKAKLRYIGPLYGQEKFTALQSSDLFIYPSNNDCYPLVLLEAMQCSTPIISSFEGGIPDIVRNNVNGFLVEASAIDEMAIKSLKIYNDPDLKMRLSSMSRKLYEDNNTVEVFENRLSLVIDQIITEIEND